MTKTAKKPRKGWARDVAFGGSLAMVGGYVAALVVARPGNLQEWALLGDALAPFAVAFSIAAIAVAMLSVELQGRELRLQRQELQESRKVMQEQREQFEKTARAQEDLAESQARLASAQVEANRLTDTMISASLQAELLKALMTIHASMGKSYGGGEFDRTHLQIAGLVAQLQNILKLHMQEREGL